MIDNQFSALVKIKCHFDFTPKTKEVNFSKWQGRKMTENDDKERRSLMIMQFPITLEAISEYDKRFIRGKFMIWNTER